MIGNEPVVAFLFLINHTIVLSCSYICLIFNLYIVSGKTFEFAFLIEVIVTKRRLPLMADHATPLTVFFFSDSDI